MTENLNQLTIFITAFIAIMALYALYTRQNRNNRRFDERQKANRGKAYQAAYCTLIAYIIICGFVDYIAKLHWTELLPGIVIGVCLSLLVFVIICIKNGAYLAIKEKPQQAMATLAFVLLVNIPACYRNIFVGDGIITNGMLNIHAISPIVWLMVLISLIAIGIQSYQDKINERKEME
jgi:uncharacterized membrane protein (DUF485 family)